MARPVPASLRRGVELRDVTFAHPGAAPVLHRLTLTITPGETVALVGANGAGKTTLVKLLTRCTTPPRGKCW